MLMRVFVNFMIIIAVVVGILALVLPREPLVNLIMFRDFFDVTLPILAFAALIKYLCTKGVKKCPGCKCTVCKCANKENLNR